MAFSLDKNSIEFQRMKNLAIAARQISREAQAIKDVYNQEMKPGGTPNAAYVNTTIATTAEFDTAISFLTEFITFYGGGGTLANTNRGLAWLLPFLDDTVN